MKCTFEMDGEKVKKLIQQTVYDFLKEHGILGFIRQLIQKCFFRLRKNYADPLKQITNLKGRVTRLENEFKKV